MSYTAYPLDWPGNVARTARPCSARFRTTFAAARDGIMRELALMRATHVVLSTNVELRRDGLPYANRPQPTDRGAAVFFMWREKQYAFPMDSWDKVEDNLQAIRKSIEAMRGLERWGGLKMVEASFSGFLALPRGGDSGWRDVLGITGTPTKLELRRAYGKAIAVAHPDAGGSVEAAARINDAYVAGKAELSNEGQR